MSGLTLIELGNIPKRSKIILRSGGLSDSPCIAIHLYLLDARASNNVDECLLQANDHQAVAREPHAALEQFCGAFKGFPEDEHFYKIAWINL